MAVDPMNAEFLKISGPALNSALNGVGDSLEFRAVALATYIGIRRIQMARAAMPTIDIFDEAFLEALVGEI